MATNNFFLEVEYPLKNVTQICSWGCFTTGQALKMLVHMSKAKRILEIGMFTGYGALSMAEGLPEDGRLVACELEPYLKEFAQPIFDKSPHGKKITVKIGSAMETLKVRDCQSCPSNISQRHPEGCHQLHSTLVL